MICLNETFLDEGVRDDQVWLGGYTLASRRDRQDGRGGGGVLCFVADRFAQHIVLREHSEIHERSWHIIHSDIGPILCEIRSEVARKNFVSYPKTQLLQF